MNRQILISQEPVNVSKPALLLHIVLVLSLSLVLQSAYDFCTYGSPAHEMVGLFPHDTHTHSSIAFVWLSLYAHSCLNTMYSLC